MKRLLVCIATATAGVGCSSVQTRVSEAPTTVLRADRRYELLMRTGDAHLDSVVYELAASTPCTENTFFANSIPTVVTLSMIRLRTEKSL